MVEGFVETSAGGRLWFSDVGAGPSVVFVHAGIADSRMWDGCTTRLVDRYRAVTYDQRGYGRSSPLPSAAFSPLTDLEQLLDNVEVDRAVLVGASMGGGLVIDYLLAHPDRVAAAVTVAAAVSGLPPDDHGGDSRFAELQSTASSGDLGRFGEVALDIWAPLKSEPEVDARIREQLLDNAAAMLATFAQAQPGPPAHDRLQEIAVPVLVVVGDSDSRAVERSADAVADRVPGARKEVLAGVDHNVPERAGARFVDLLDGFLSSLPSG
jgi:pimeloyl-ACP methyl ester carboxylesterase